MTMANIEGNFRQFSAGGRGEVQTPNHKCIKGVTLSSFMEMIIAHLHSIGKQRTSETYQATLRSFMEFRKGREVMIHNIDSELLQMYEAYLLNKGLKRNTSSFYLRVLRAVYNRALEDNLIIDQRPFRHVYLGIDETTRRAISLEDIRMIKALDLEENWSLAFARDMFLFSFYTRGMSFVDMAYLMKTDVSSGVLSYSRRKTGKQLIVGWEGCMQSIVDQYYDNESEYLLPIITVADIDARKQYLKKSYQVNKNLKEIGRMIQLSLPLTMYVARHSWASVARDKNIPLSVISEGMGHNSQLTTQIYLTSIKSSEVDKANKLILKFL